MCLKSHFFLLFVLVLLYAKAFGDSNEYEREKDDQNDKQKYEKSRKINMTETHVV